MRGVALLLLELDGSSAAIMALCSAVAAAPALLDGGPQPARLTLLAQSALALAFLFGGASLGSGDGSRVTLHLSLPFHQRICVPAVLAGEEHIGRLAPGLALGWGVVLLGMARPAQLLPVAAQALQVVATGASASEFAALRWASRTHGACVRGAFQCVRCSTARAVASW